MNGAVDDQVQWTRAFPLGPDNAALFAGGDYRHALEGLCGDLRRGCRLLCLTGPAGIGKSMLLHSLRARLPRGFVSAISQPPLGDLLARLADGLGLGRVADEADLQVRCRPFFAARRAENIPVVQIIDDAETLSREDLAMVRRVFEGGHGQVLLVGQPQMLALFDGEAGPAGRPPDRVYHLEPLSLDEVGAYVRHRLNEAGYDRGLFAPEAIAAISAYSGGLPRLINLLCFAVLAGADLAQQPIAAAQVHDAARHRAKNGSYPFLQPPLPPRSAATPSDDGVAVVVDEDGGRRWLQTGYGRMGLALAAGVGLGMAFAGTPISHSLKPEATRAATAMSAAVGGHLRRMQAGLAEMGATIQSWTAAPAAPKDPAPDPLPDVAALERSPPLPEVAPPPADQGDRQSREVAPDDRAVPPSGAGEAARLTPSQRQHLAGLYADRADYEMRGGRWYDARISILRGLRLQPDHPRLREYDRSVRAVIEPRRSDHPAGNDAAPPGRPGKDPIARPPTDRRAPP